MAGGVLGPKAEIRLTGRRRHRAGLFGRLVLQVEEASYLVKVADGPPLGEHWRRWRDAKTEDLEQTDVV